MLNIAASALCEIKYEACGKDANKAQGKGECFMNIEAVLFLHKA